MIMATGYHILAKSRW